MAITFVAQEMEPTNAHKLQADNLLWLLLPLVQVIALLLLPWPANRYELLLAGSFVLITGIASYQLFTDKRSYSLNKIWWLFGAIFLGFVPSIQAAVHHSPWHDGDILPRTMLYANGLILVCFLLYYLLLNIRKNKAPTPIIIPTVFPNHYVRRFRLVAPVAMVVSLLCLLIAYGAKGLLLRGHAETASLQYNSAFQLLFDKGLRGLMLYLSVAAILLYRQRSISGGLLALILLTAFAGNFPLALPRYLAFTIYLSWVLAAGFRWMKRRYLFTGMILALLLLAGPVVDVTRYAGSDMAARMRSPAALFRKSYLTSDFDAYSSLCRVMQYVHIHGSTGGRQLGGVALFFVPRNLWPAKPIGSGAYLFTMLGYEFKNVSCTYLAEGYINFGIAGSLLFTLIIALIIRFYDAYYRRYSVETTSYKTIFYFVLCGMLLFLLRGDLLSSFAYTCGLLVSGWAAHRLLMARIFKQ